VPRDRFWRVVLATAAVGAAIRLAMLVSKWDQPILLNDSFWYSGIAQGIAKGEWFEGFFDVSGAEHAPLTPLLLAPASFLPRPEFWQRATNDARRDRCDPARRRHRETTRRRGGRRRCRSDRGPVPEHLDERLTRHVRDHRDGARLGCHPRGAPSP
jgi:hypothetical protein